MADDPVTARLDEVRVSVQRVHGLFSARPPREADEDLGVGTLLGHAISMEKALRLLAQAHRPVQQYLREDDCGHLEPEDGEADDWHEWDAAHPWGQDLEGGGGYRVCLERPLGQPACPACTGLVRSYTGSDTAEVPSDECIMRPVLTGHLAREERNGG